MAARISGIAANKYKKGAAPPEGGISRVELPPEILEQVLAQIGAPEARRPEAHKAFEWAINNYLMWSGLRGAGLTPSSTKAHIQYINDATASLLETLAQIHPIQAIILGVKLGTFPGLAAKPMTLVTVEAALQSLQASAQQTLVELGSQNSRPRNVILETHVEAFMVLTERFGGRPRMTNVSQTDVVVTLFLAADPKLRRTTIVNKVNAIRKRGGDGEAAVLLADSAMMQPVTFTPF